MPETGGSPLRKKVIFLAVLGLVALAGLFWFIANRGAEPALGELNPEVFATLLQAWPNEGHGIMFPEENLEQFPYSAIAYAEFAEGLAADTPCASWENGGISWWDPSEVSWERSSVSAEEYPELWAGWNAIAKFPSFRFCGFPAPYPEKPMIATPSK